MKRYTVILLLCLSVAAEAQVVSLKECWQKAAESYPRLKDSQEYEQIAMLRIGSLETGYLPRLDANAQASYQSDVTHLDLSKVPIPGLAAGAPDKDQYKLTVDMSQLIWDGGMIRASKKVELAGLDVDKKQVAVDMYAIRGRVAQLFFGVALKEQQLKIQEALKADLLQKLKKTSSAVRNGALLKSNELILRAEILKLEQEMISAESDRRGVVDALSILIGSKLSYEVSFVWNEAPPAGGLRPEYELFKLQKDRLDASNLLLSAKRMPKITAFGQLGYSKPGLNMFKNEFDGYYLVGLKATWNIFDWNVAKRDRQVIRHQQSLIDTKQQLFEQSRQMELAQEAKTEAKYEKLLAADAEVVAARLEVAKAYSVMYDNGSIDAADYVSRQTELKQAELNAEQHRILLSFSRVNINVINGN